MEKEEVSPPNFWWTAKFKIAWPENSNPVKHIDLLIAHRVILPVLGKNREDISLWRFHRRWPPDADGHQFRFDFYCSKESASDIFGLLKSVSILQELVKQKIIEEEIYEEDFSIGRCNIEYICNEKSEEQWPTYAKKSWPYFIMGVSQMWLNLIGNISKTIQIRENASLQDLITHYAQIHKEISGLWQALGQDIFLHHVNAMFAYELIRIAPRSQLQLLSL